MAMVTKPEAREEHGGLWDGDVIRSYADAAEGNTWIHVLNYEL